jgi:hypothetical protein
MAIDFGIFIINYLQITGFAFYRKNTEKLYNEKDKSRYVIFIYIQK